jgi:hypothetical protein
LQEVAPGGNYCNEFGCRHPASTATIEHMFVNVEVTERAMRIVVTWVEPGSPTGDRTDRIMTSAVEIGRSAAARRDRAGRPQLRLVPGGC